MSKFKIEIAEEAQMEFQNFDAKTQKIVARKILNLENGELFGVKKLVAHKNVFRIRAGNFRVIFEIYFSKKFIKITRVRRRNEKTYRWKFYFEKYRGKINFEFFPPKKWSSKRF